MSPQDHPAAHPLARAAPTVRFDVEVPRDLRNPLLDAPGVPDALPSTSVPGGPVITVTIGPDTVFSVSGESALLSRLPIAQHDAVVAALAHALHLVTSSRPAPSALQEAVDAMEELTALLGPTDAQAAHDAIAAPVIARCQTLIAAAKPSIPSRAGA